MKIESRDDMKFDLRKQSDGLYSLHIRCGENYIELWLVNKELEKLKEVLNI